MKIKFFIPILVFIPVIIVQLTIIPLISIEEIAPDLILITLVYFSISYGQLFGTSIGAFYGLAFDLITGSLIGSNMLAKTVAGFTAGYFSSETRRDKYLYTYAFCVIVFLCSIINSLIFSFFSVIDFNTNFIALLFNQSLLPSIYTALFSILIVLIPHKKSYT
ncbi:MAG: rod shape-determining protein MreD [Ignavibacteria bacterium]|nr:rod shape-determining protein MreD [Ignavibacteria bacterium]MBT8382857.1 rod shape-determining protein MreD [Ignavibacteria bacterium]MBT8392860.1 rod shape-determining protein MreD [Ignavibacteria bacterium]NNJ53097.1 rod shape-determining protein MreD [Ignavibacteriaceae bacterium]NNL20639.1 rod shape-determining protein MreD [Ignavibacteriaceae bacterium]